MLDITLNEVLIGIALAFIMMGVVWFTTDDK